MALLQASKTAWECWQGETTSYRRDAARLVIDAKREETRERRLRSLIDDSVAGSASSGCAGTVPEHRARGQGARTHVIEERLQHPDEMDAISGRAGWSIVSARGMFVT
jgi:hypothetical protein